MYNDFKMCLLCIICNQYTQFLHIPVPLRSKVWVWRHFIAGIVGSNTAEGMDVRLLCLFVLCR
jgi:hypothetical protein